MVPTAGCHLQQVMGTKEQFQKKLYKIWTNKDNSNKNVINGNYK